MRKIFLFLAAIIMAAATSFAQPGQRIALTNLQRATIVESSRAGQIGLTNSNGDQRYAQFTEIDLTPILYTPTSTGNTQNYSEFVTTPSGDIWYIDWQGRGVRLYNAAAGASDLDWLEIDTNTPPNNIRDSMYTYSYASFNARMVWPGANVFVNDSITSADVVIQGNRQARVALYNLLNGAWTDYVINGSEASVLLGGGATTFTVSTAGGTPTGPSSGVNHFQVNTADSTIRIHQYPSSRRDAVTPENFLYTDPSGIVRSKGLAALPGAAYEYQSPECNPPDIVPDPILGPLTGWNTDCLEQWAWIGNEWVLSGSPGGGGSSGPDSTFVKVNGSYANKRITDNVYKNGTLGVRTDDTTGVVNVATKNGASYKPMIFTKGVSNGADSVNLFLLSKSSDTTAAPFLFGVTNSGNISSSGKNSSFYWGQNIYPGGAKIQAGKPALFQFWETNFTNSMPVLGNIQTYEWHMAYVPSTSGGADQRRILTSAYDWQGRIGNFGVKADQFTFYKFGSIFPGKPSVYASIDFFNNTFDFNDTMNIVLRKPNIGGFFGTKSDNSVVNLISIDTINRVAIAPGNATTIFTGANTIEGRAGIKLTANQTGNVTIGDNVKTGGVIFQAAASEVLRFQNPLSTTGWAFSLNGYELAIKDMSVGRSIFQVEENGITDAQYIHADGRICFGGRADFDAQLHLKKTALGRATKMFRIENSTGGNNFFRSDVAPEGAITANPGDVCFAGVSGTGHLYLKLTGTGNTGWVDLISSFTNIYNSNGTIGANRIATLTDRLILQKTTDAGTGFQPLSLRVGGNDAGFLSLVSPVNGDSLFYKRINNKGYLMASNANIVIQNTDQNIGLEIDETSKTTIVSGAIATNSSSQQDITTTPVAISQGVHTVVLQPGASVATLPEIGTGAGQVRQGTMYWVTNFSGGSATVEAFSGELINTAASATLSNLQSAWVKAIGPADWAIIKSN